MDEKLTQAEIDAKKNNAPDFPQNLGEYLSNPKNRSNPIDVCETPNALIAIGAKPLPVVINPNDIDKCLSQRTANKNKNSHDLTVDELVSLPELLANPVFIFQEQDPSKPNYITIVTDKFDKDGNPLVIGVELNLQKDWGTVNRVSTMHGRDRAFESFIANNGNEVQGYIPRNIAEGNLLAINIEKAPNFLRPAGLQLPEGSEVMSFDNSIPHNFSSVKSFDKNNFESVLNAESEQKTETAPITNPKKQEQIQADKPAVPDIMSQIKDIEKQKAVLNEKIKAVKDYKETWKTVENPDIAPKAKENYRQRHIGKFVRYEAALKVFKKYGITKLPKLEKLRAELAELDTKSKELYREYSKENKLENASKKAAERNTQRIERKPPEKSKSKGERE